MKNEIAVLTKQTGQLSPQTALILTAIGVVITIGVSVGLPGILTIPVLAILVGSAWAARPIVACGIVLFSSTCLPKSISGISLGSMTFGWGAGDVMLLLLSLIVLLGALRMSFQLPLLGGWRAMDQAVVLFVLANVIAALVAILLAPDKAVFTLGALAKGSEPMLFYILLRVALRDEADAAASRAVFVATIAGVVAISALENFFPQAYLAMFRTITTNSSQDVSDWMGTFGWRISGPFGNPNSLAEFTIISTMFLAGEVAHAKLVNKIVMIVLIAAGIGALILTLSREAYLGAILAFAWYVRKTGLAKQRRWAAIMVLLGVILTSWLLWDSIYNRIYLYSFGGSQVDTGYLAETGSASARIEQWKAGAQALIPYGIFGVGLERSPDLIEKYLPAGSSDYGGTHQTFLRATLEGGLIMLCTMCYMLLNIWRKGKSLGGYRGIALEGMLLGLILTGLFGDTFQNSTVLSALFFILPSLPMSAEAGVKQPLRRVLVRRAAIS